MATKKVKTTGTGGPNRFCTREEAKTGSRVRRRREDSISVQDVGYSFCVCRDCFEIVVGGICDACKDAGCDINCECQAPGAYGEE
jgi:hypothetical protein